MASSDGVFKTSCAPWGLLRILAAWHTSYWCKNQRNEVATVV